MTTYIPGAGIKRPMAMLEAPVYPDIRRGPTEVKSAGKHWRVDSGRTLLAAEGYPQFQESALLAVSYDYPTESTGISSHKDVVNKNFRPPIIEPYLIYEPLTRQPRTEVVPRINPTAARWSTRNERMDTPERFMTDLIKNGQLDVGVRMPFGDGVPDLPLPDLELILDKTNVGKVSGHAAQPFFDPIKSDPSNIVPAILEEPMTISATARSVPQVRYDGVNAWEDMYLPTHGPQVSAGAGYETFVRIDGENAESRRELFTKMPEVSVTPFKYTPYTTASHGAWEDMHLDYSRPQVSATAIAAPIFTTEVDTGMDGLVLDSKLQAPQITAPQLPMSTDDVRNYTPDSGLLDQIMADKITAAQITRPESSYRDQSHLRVRTPFHTRMHVPGEVKLKGFVPQHGLLGAPTPKLQTKLTAAVSQGSAGIMIPRMV